MKIELILFFVMACMAQAEDDYPLDQYPLLQDSFADTATLRYLDGYLVGKGRGILPCYVVVKDKLDEIANAFKSNLTKAKNVYKNFEVTHRKVAEYLTNLLIKISEKIKSCQKEVWETMEHSKFEEAAEVLWKCKPEISQLVNRYESHSVNIKDETSREKFTKKMNEIIAETEGKFKEVNHGFEKCANGTFSIQ